MGLRTWRRRPRYPEGHMSQKIQERSLQLMPAYAEKRKAVSLELEDAGLGEPAAQKFDLSVLTHARDGDGVRHDPHGACGRLESPSP